MTSWKLVEHKAKNQKVHDMQNKSITNIGNKIENIQQLYRGKSLA